jgi:hypothetical protein
MFMNELSSLPIKQEVASQKYISSRNDFSLRGRQRERGDNYSREIRQNCWLLPVMHPNGGIIIIIPTSSFT